MGGPADPADRAGPVRTCVGCRRRAPAAELMRIGIDPTGQPAIGRTLAGRGAWLCAGSVACFDLAVRRNGFGRALRIEVDPARLPDLRNHVARFPADARG